MSLDWNESRLQEYLRLVAEGQLPGAPTIIAVHAPAWGTVDLVVETTNAVDRASSRLLMGMRFRAHDDWDLTSELLMRLDEFFGSSERYARGEVELIDGIWWHRHAFRGHLA